MNRPDVLGPLTHLFAALSHKKMYELMTRFSGPAAFRPVTSDFSIDDDGAFRIEIVIDSRYEGSLPFFHILQGCFEGVPGVAGLSDAIVSAEISPHVGTFRVVPPPSRRFFAWPARVWRALTRSGSPIDEMAHQHDELRQSLRDLDAANKRLALQEDRYRRLAENSSDIIAEWDEAGNCQYVSPSVTKLLGYLPSDFQARSIGLVHPDDRRLLQGALRARVHSDEAGRAIFRVLHLDGSWRWFEGASSSFTMSSGERRAVTGARDITERIALEERLTQSQKMEAIGRLAGGVAHDFNNLLMVIVGSTELLTHGLELIGPTLDADGNTSGGDVEPLLRAAQNVRGAADRAAGLTRSLLAFSRQQPVRRRAVDFNEVVGDMSEILRRVLGEDVSLSISTAPTTCVVEADPTQLEQVLLSLVANARDAMLDGGRLEIELAVVELGAAGLRKLSPNHELAPGAYARLRGSRNECRNPCPSLRALLHDQGRRRQCGTRALDCLRHRATEWWDG
jgi:PAS domain S-box-containing protein